MGRGGVGSSGAAYDLILGPKLELLGCDPQLLESLGWRGTALPVDLQSLLEGSPGAAPDVEALVGAALEAVSRGTGTASGTPASESELPAEWVVEPLLTAQGAGCRLRWLGGLGGSPLDPSEFWGREVAHQLRNQLTGVVTALYALREDAAEPVPHPAAEAHASCVELASGGIRSSIALLESFTSLAFPDPVRGSPTVAECFRSFETLIEPRARRRFATVESDPGPVGSISVDGRSAGRVLSAVALAALPLLEKQTVLRLAGRPRDGETVEFTVTVRTGESDVTAQFRAELGGWVSVVESRTPECGLVVSRARTVDMLSEES